MTDKPRNPNVRGRPTFQVRMDREQWMKFGEVAQPDRSAVLRDFIDWYLREPGAKMPKRPDQPPGTSI